MKIIYEDMVEFAEVVTRCSETVSLEKCEFCPLFDRCEATEMRERRIVHGGEIEDQKKPISVVTAPGLPGRD